VLVSLLCALALVLAACGGSGNRDSILGQGISRIAVRVNNGRGEFVDPASGARFTPRGSSYTRLASQVKFFGGTTFYHSTFNVQAYDAARSDAALLGMQAAGFNIVRVFLNGCCPGSIGNPSGGLNPQYLDNLADFIGRATAHGLRVIVTTDFVADAGGYDELMSPDCCATFDGNNLNFLTSRGVRANSKFWGDVAAGLRQRNVPAGAIFAYELRNELAFDSDRAPLSLDSGVVTTANGQSYDMAEPAAKRKMRDDNLTFWVDQVSAAIRQNDPGAIVTVGFFQPQQPNPSRIGDPRVIDSYPAVANSTIDYVSLHAYPGFELNLPQFMQNFAVNSFAKPIVMEEFGAAKSVYGDPATGASALRTWQNQSCSFGFSGWLVWTWDTEEQPDFWNANSGSAEIRQALSPALHPDPCS